MACSLSLFLPPSLHPPLPPLPPSLSPSLPPSLIMRHAHRILYIRIHKHISDCKKSQSYCKDWERVLITYDCQLVAREGGYDSPRLQDQLVIPETVCLPCVRSIWRHKCTGWLSGSKRNSVHSEASPWSCSRVAPFSVPGEMPFSCMTRPQFVPCHLLLKELVV